MLRVTSLNVNGLRSAFRKGLSQWLDSHQPDVVCLQEVKAHEIDLDQALLRPTPYDGHFHCAEKKGYSGVGIYTRHAPKTVFSGIGLEEFDREGRLIAASWENLTIVSAYLPSGSSGDERQAVKMRFLDAFAPWLDNLMRTHRESGHEFIICGDWNIAHKEIDLKNWRGNRKNSGFLPEERDWLTHVFNDIGFVDVFRQLEPGEDHYTWWSNRGQAWAKNVGWRIDYQIATPGIAASAKRTEIFKAERYSDHAPLTIDYDVSIG
ncbi:exodeoxyribonuclease III [Orrella daihaiensis]|uniref:Exodeoxyribonuclease III n=1 Tax=Orrella daihaiensis TaxID=2782176 RepID=A0ABY4ALD0_9BURK|nr:exodeoxyribonuclease III [Orrella daihaiensis]UOD50225.1 exodeoxyribonuclease III [Orrella daihaiensis]